MQELIFATNNQNKVMEIQSLLPSNIKAVSLKDAGINIDIPEPHNTLEENASEKSVTIFRLTNKDCFSEDTGLEVMALGGEPGVRSARYAGNDSNAEQNILKLLDNMKNQQNKQAQFKTVISLILNGKEIQFTGICEGEIISSPRGANGFGYDPVFIPSGADKTFAEMSLEEKNKYSHRKKATALLLQYLTENYGKN